MQSETARVTTARESSYRVQYPNSTRRDVKVVALDALSASLVDEVSREPWNGAKFFTSLSFSTDSAPGTTGEGLKAWLKDLAGAANDLVEEVASSDFVVVVTSAGEDARAVSLIADACALHNKSLVALVVPGPETTDAQISDSMTHLRPFARMLVIASGADYISAMLTALRA
jgi:hypothetical protein